MSVGKPGCGAVWIFTAFARLFCISKQIQSSPTSICAPASFNFDMTASSRFGSVLRQVIFPFEIAAATKKVPVSIRSETISCVPPPKLSTPSISMRIVPAPVILAPSIFKNLAVSTISGSHAAFSITVLPSAKVAADIIVTVAPTLTLSITI